MGLPLDSYEKISLPSHLKRNLSRHDPLGPNRLEVKFLKMFLCHPCVFSRFHMPCWTAGCYVIFSIGRGCYGPSTSLALQLIELTPTTLRKDGHSDGTACTEPARGGKAKSLHQAVNGRTLLLLLLLLLVAAAAAVFGPVHPKLKKLSEKLHGFCKKKKDVNTTNFQLHHALAFSRHLLVFGVFPQRSYV